MSTCSIAATRLLFNHGRRVHLLQRRMLLRQWTPCLVSNYSTYTSENPTADKDVDSKTDFYWMGGSIAVFGSTLIYLLSKDSHHHPIASPHPLPKLEQDKIKQKYEQEKENNSSNDAIQKLNPLPESEIITEPDPTPAPVTAPLSTESGTAQPDNILKTPSNHNEEDDTKLNESSKDVSDKVSPPKIEPNKIETIPMEGKNIHKTSSVKVTDLNAQEATPSKRAKKIMDEKDKSK